jgi:D-tyrosyl-tRNA(Tyr) deacylase
MRALIQRVSEASVTIEGTVTATISTGFLVLLGVEEADGAEDAVWLATKIAKMRLFSDEEGKMNAALDEVEGDVLVVSQFTLHASTKKGNRPSYIRAARPEQAIPLYEKFVHELESALGKKVPTGVFGADMKVALVNDGPVTIWMDSRAKE